jgi:hypothetical protein
VGSGQVLTVQAGTAVFGSTTVTPSFLEIDRGGQIIANGTLADPIIFTSELAPSETADLGDWGGLVINGRACANCANTAAGDSCASEGGNAGHYGGTNDSDNSGSLTYVRIEFCGFNVALDNELNCLTMNAVGSATQVSYIQTHRGLDDLFEWFGGTVNCHHLYGTWGDDDGLDFQMGYRGKVQFAIMQQNPDGITNLVDKGIEGDNNEFSHNNPLCRSNPTFANLTLVGTRQQNPATTVGGPGIHFRRGARGQVLNSIVLGHRLCGFDFDDTGTVGGGFGPDGVVYCSGTSAAQEPVSGGGQLRARAFPNPFQTSALISFRLPGSQKTTVRVFSLEGRLIDTLADGMFEAGSHEIAWNAPAEIPGGIYFYTVSAGPHQDKGRLVLAR